MKNLNFLILMVSLLFLQGCRTEFESEQTIHNNYTPSRKIVSLKEAGPFKEYIDARKSGSAKNTLSKTGSDLLSVLSDNSKIAVIIKDSIISYSTVIRYPDRSSDVLVYSIDSQQRSIAFRAEYTPADRTKNYKIDSFTGTVMYETLDGEYMGTFELKNSIAVPGSGNKSNYAGKSNDCTYELNLVEVRCSEDLHNPNQIGGCTADTKPYYILEMWKKCSSFSVAQLPNMGAYEGGGANGGGGNGEVPVDVPMEVTFNIVLENNDFPPLSPEQYAYIQNHPHTGSVLLGSMGVMFSENQRRFTLWLIDYLRQNNTWGLSDFEGSMKIVAFSQFGQGYLMGSSDPSLWRQFENWFLTKSEGDDGEYVENIEDILSNLTYQTRQMPTYSQFVSAFPKLDYPGYPDYYKQMPAAQVYPKVGGHLESLYNNSQKDNGPYRNACTVRWSMGLNGAGVLIPNNNLSRRGADLNGQPRYYFLKAITAGDFMQKTFGNPTHKLEGANANGPVMVADFLKGKTGIYVIVNKDQRSKADGGPGYSGHVDLIQNGHIPGGANAYDVTGGIKSIRIWEFQP